MKDLINDIILGSVFILIGMIITSLFFLFTDKPKENCSTQAHIGGLWLPDIKDLAKYSGKYMCININEMKSLKQLEETCSHEIGHEVFARICEKNITKCEEIAE